MPLPVPKPDDENSGLGEDERMKGWCGEWAINLRFFSGLEQRMRLRFVLVCQRPPRTYCSPGPAEVRVVLARAQS